MDYTEYRTVCGIIVKVISFLLIPLYIFIFISLKNLQKNVFILINILFNMTCIIQTLSYLLPNGPKVNPIICSIQASTCLFGEISKITLATGFLLVAFLTFLDPTGIEANKTMYFLVIFISCQFLPLVYAVVTGIYGEAKPLAYFCFFSSKPVFTITAIIRYVVIGLFFVITTVFIIYFKKTLSSRSDEDFSADFGCRMMRFYFLMFFTLLLLLSCTILDSSADKNSTTTNIMYGIADICDGILTPLYAIVFLLDKKRIEEIKEIMCCQKKELLIDADDTQMEIIL